MGKWIKPDINTKFHIDLEWWHKQGRDFRVHLQSHLCPKCQTIYTNHLEAEEIDWIDPETAEVTKVDGLWQCLRTHCSALPDYITEKRINDQVEVGGMCCTAWDITRRDPKAKVVGPISWQLRFIRSGKADVIVVDEQCVNTNVVNEAKKVGAPVISTCDKAVMGLPDRSDDPVDRIVEELVEGKIAGVYFPDHHRGRLQFKRGHR